MTDTQTPQLLDFNNPRKPRKTRWRVLSKWHQSICVLTTEAWNALLAHETTLSPSLMDPYQCRDALRRLPEDGIAVQFTIGPGAFPSLIVFPRRQLHGLLADILDLSGEDWPESRRFTRAEESMLNVMFQGLAHAISDGIPGPEATACLFVEMFDKPQRTRLFALIDELFVGEISITSRFGTETAWWLLPRKETEELIGKELQDEEVEERQEHPHLVSLTQRILVDVMIELGRCDVTMSQVADLAVGDVLILDQSIHRSLTGYIAGRPKLLGKPVRIGPRQGFEVAELIAD
ncbi:MAG: FliM/FliN family flagellar motor switch protein [Planctomycetaceae bacterium]